jgi:hypothetical protein
VIKMPEDADPSRFAHRDLPIGIRASLKRRT